MFLVMEKKFLKAVTVLQNLHILFSVSACVLKSLLPFILLITKQDAQLSQRDRIFAFLGPPLGDLGTTYDDRLRLIGKRVVVDFLLALIELFSLRVTAELLRAIIG